MDRLKLFFVSLFIVVGMMASNMVYAALDTKGATVLWGYTGKTGPGHWGALDADFQLCATGKTQTPIDIRHASNSKQNLLQVSYGAAPLNIVNDGITTLTVGKQQLVIKDGHTIQVNFPNSGPKEKLIVAGNVYRLMQFHFHTPSETQLNGHEFPAEIHFVNQGPNGKIAVIAVFVQPGKENPALNPILNHLPKIKGKKYMRPDIRVNPAALLPANKSYYSFMGSLTTPPCNEGLQWFVMRRPIQASLAQIAKIRQAQGGNNARPVQPTNDRQVTLHITP